MFTFISNNNFQNQKFNISLPNFNPNHFIQLARAMGTYLLLSKAWLIITIKWKCNRLACLYNSNRCSNWKELLNL